MKNHPASLHPDLLVGTSDDAGVFRLDAGRALVQTVDFFAPVVDDAYDWGRITAANALSDVYAMGGMPLTALQLVSWPRNELSFDLLEEVIRGGADVMAQAGCTIVGGHSIDGPEPNYGFAVTGLVDPERILRKTTGRAGEALILTKPLGTGIIATAIKRGDCPPEVATAAVEVMVALNDRAAAAGMEAGVSAATDITGFGFLGHLLGMLVGVGARIEAAAVPVVPGAWDLLDSGAYPGGSVRNLEAVRPHLEGEVDERIIRMLSDAQTSGGLLMAVPATGVDRLMDALIRMGVTGAVVGSLTETEGSIAVE